MQSGLYVSLSSQMALEKRLTTIADNMANVNTAGFRATEVKFDELLSDTKNKLNAKVAFVSQGNDYLSGDAGELQQTGNLLDFAIKGDAWFAIDTPAGQVLTRDGRFTHEETRRSRLHSRLSGSRRRRRADPAQHAGAGEPKVGADGTIHQNGTQVAVARPVRGRFQQGLLRHENSGVMTDRHSREPVVDRFDVGVMQGYRRGVQRQSRCRK